MARRVVISLVQRVRVLSGLAVGMAVHASAVASPAGDAGLTVRACAAETTGEVRRLWRIERASMDARARALRVTVVCRAGDARLQVAAPGRGVRRQTVPLADTDVTARPRVVTLALRELVNAVALDAGEPARPAPEEPLKPPLRSPKAVSQPFLVPEFGVVGTMRYGGTASPLLLGVELFAEMAVRPWLRLRPAIGLHAGRAAVELGSVDALAGEVSLDALLAGASIGGWVPYGGVGVLAGYAQLGGGGASDDVGTSRVDGVAAGPRLVLGSALEAGPVRLLGQVMTGYQLAGLRGRAGPETVGLAGPWVGLAIGAAL